MGPLSSSFLPYGHDGWQTQGSKRFKACFTIPSGFASENPFWHLIIQEMIDKIRLIDQGYEQDIKYIFENFPSPEAKAIQLAALHYLLLLDKECHSVNDFSHLLAGILFTAACDMRGRQKVLGSKKYSIVHEQFLLYHFTVMMLPHEGWYNVSGLYLVRAMITQDPGIRKCFKYHHLKQISTTLKQMIATPALQTFFQEKCTIDAIYAPSLRAAQHMSMHMPITTVDLHREMVRNLFSVRFQTNRDNCVAVAVLRHLKQSHVLKLFTFIREVYATGSIRVGAEERVSSYQLISSEAEMLRNNICQDRDILGGTPFFVWSAAIKEQSQFTNFQIAEIYSECLFSTMEQITLAAFELFGMNGRVEEKGSMKEMLYEHVLLFMREHANCSVAELDLFHTHFSKKLWFRDLSNVRMLFLLKGETLQPLSSVEEISRAFVSIIPEEDEDKRKVFKGEAFATCVRNFIKKEVEKSEEKIERLEAGGKLFFPVTGGVGAHVLSALNVDQKHAIFKGTSVADLLRHISTFQVPHKLHSALFGHDRHFMTVDLPEQGLAQIEKSKEAMLRAAALKEKMQVENDVLKRVLKHAFLRSPSKYIPRAC